jgi:dihydrodipicolinate reductase
MPTPAAHGEHEIILARKDEVLTIKITDYSSAIYSETVFIALRKVKRLPAGSVISSLAELPGGMSLD